VPHLQVVVFAQPPGGSFVKVTAAPGDFIADLAKAIIAESKQLEGCKPDQLVLKREGSDTPLDPTGTVEEAGLLTGGKIKLVVELTAAVPGAGAWEAGKGMGRGVCRGGHVAHPRLLLQGPRPSRRGLGSLAGSTFGPSCRRGLATKPLCVGVPGRRPRASALGHF
jgi:hypothetical protein